MLVDFSASPDFEPVSAIVDDQLEYIGLVLELRVRQSSIWLRDSEAHHVACVRLPFEHRNRPVKDVRPRGTSGVEVPAAHFDDPDAT